MIPKRLFPYSASILLLTVFFLTGGTAIVSAAETVAWSVNNLTTWADAHYGITNGGDGKTHVITVSGNVAIPPSSSFTNTFGNVKDLTIILQGTGTITISNNGYLLLIGDRQTVIAKDLTLQGRENTVPLVRVEYGGTFRMEGRAKVTGNTASSGNGGGVNITAGGTFIMQDEAAVSGNMAGRGGASTTAAQGGGVYVRSGTFTMKGGSISGNTAHSGYGNVDGGGVYVDGGTFTMESGSISNNTASGGSNALGGGVHIHGGTFAMKNGTISGNEASSRRIAYGGGVYTIMGTFAMEKGAISGNTASAINTSSGSVVNAKGGGVYNLGSTFTVENGGGLSSVSTFTMESGVISGNTASGGSNAKGGGVYGSLAMNGGTISGNTASATNNINANMASADGGGFCMLTPFTKTGGIIYGNYAPDGLGNIAIGGRGHAIYHDSVSGVGGVKNYRNAAVEPNEKIDRLDFWLNETDITYTITPNGSPVSSLVFTFSEDPGNLLACQIILDENVSGRNARLTGSGNTRTLSPVTVSGNGIVNFSIHSIYCVETGSKTVRILPGTPTVTTVESASTVTLKWDPAYLATGYRVYRSDSASGRYALIGTTTTTQFVDIERHKTTTYYYRVIAYNSAGESDVPAQVSATTLNDNTELAIPATSDTIVIEWPRETFKKILMDIFNVASEFTRRTVWIISGLTFDPGRVSTKTSYVIYRDEVLVKEIEIPMRYGLIQDNSEMDHYYVDTGLEPNTAHNYRVVAKVYVSYGLLGSSNEEKKDIVDNISATTLPAQ